MAIKFPDTENLLDGLVKWMKRGPWPEYLQATIDDHFHAYCDLYDLETFAEMDAKIGEHWVSTVNDIAVHDFLSRETEDGNVVDLYLKRRGWKEKVDSKAYLRAVRDSVMSLYEVSDIRPGESFMARDLILGGDPILVEERDATKTLLQWEQFALRIIKYRGHNIVAGGVLPYSPELSAQVVEEILLRVNEIEAEFDERVSDQDEASEPEMFPELALIMALKLSTPLFSETWLTETALDPDEIETPDLVNDDGDEVEFIQLRWSVAQGVTQGQLGDMLNDAAGMKATSSTTWNWVLLADDVSQSMTKRTGYMTHRPHIEGGFLVLGMIELTEKKLLANVNSVERAARLQQQLKDILGDMVSEPLLVHQTMEQAMAAYQDRPVSNEQVDPLSEVENQIPKSFYDRHYRETLDQPIAMLDEMSPRAAVKMPEGKEKVVAWLKILELKEARVSQSRNSEPYDFLWMWNELGISDLRK